MQFARRSWIAAVCVLGVLLGTSAVQAQQHKLLPDDTEMVVTINIQQILKSELAKENKQILDLAKEKVNEALDGQGTGKWLKKANFDLFRDLGSLTIAVPAGRADEKEVVLILEGNFDAEKIEAAATEASNEAGGGLKVVKIANVKAFEVSPKGEQTVYIGILNKKTMIATATKTDFADAVARLNGTKKSNLKPAVKSLLETVNNKQTISAVVTGPLLVKLMEKAPMGGQKVPIDALKQLEGLSFTLTVQKNVDFQVGLNTQDDKTAAKFAILTNFAISTIRDQVAQKAKNDEKAATALEVLKTIKATSQGNNLVIRGQVSFEIIGKLLQAIPMPN